MLRDLVRYIQKRLPNFERIFQDHPVPQEYDKNKNVRYDGVENKTPDNAIGDHVKTIVHERGGDDLIRLLSCVINNVEFEEAWDAVEKGVDGEEDEELVDAAGVAFLRHDDVFKATT